ncbi:MAG: hypothetical protein Q8P98_00465, partial [Candidatus Rokubacteria bacterium]|nr:hypothetical protein [Candidatus Rokubacteria bacterium]
MTPAAALAGLALLGAVVLAAETPDAVAGEPATAEWPVHGFVQGAAAYRLIQPDRCPRTQRLTCKEDLVLGEGRARIELTPRGERWALVAKGEMIFDALGPEVDGELREGYLDLALGLLDLRIGRQVITWGVGDLVFVNDVFPKDWVAFISGLPLEYLKKGSDA